MISCYEEHLKELISRYETILEQLDYDVAVVSSGHLVGVANDDRTYSFIARASAQQWVPYDIHPNSYIVFRTGQKPILVWPAHKDFWHLSPVEPNGEWVKGWDLIPHTDNNDWITALKGRVAWIGPFARNMPPDITSVHHDPEVFVRALSYYRVYKTDYEVAAMSAASHQAVRGHLAAEQAFKENKSEAEIYLAFLAASKQLESLEPYSGIVALNESGATLHYERRSYQRHEKQLTLLIDAGAKVNGYASDITRTHTLGTSIFSDVLQRMEFLQVSLSQMVKPGVAMKTLHQRAELGIANILNEVGICRLSAEEQIEKEVTKAFFPHGLGHLLGLNVHDFGAEQVQPFSMPEAGTTSNRLRLSRELEKGMVITIEPGLYFNHMLIDGLIKNEPQHGLDLDLIETLFPYGGIRIEDNINVLEGSGRNLTREAFAALG
ncbi:Xaa-Pro dipeptidase [Kangiella sp.]|uniref:Xaa-Pro dipeptidase n=1 Tax=Kangiella sp. TaxID=1920245 RepID=UPI003A92CEEA